VSVPVSVSIAFAVPSFLCEILRQGGIRFEPSVGAAINLRENAAPFVIDIRDAAEIDR
jgi:hypothetical protein